MATNAFNLYRVRLFKNPQISLWEGLDRTEALRLSLFSKPSIQGRGANQWHIGNVEAISDRAIAFRFGRESPSTKESFDPIRHDFRQQDEPVGPSSSAIIDLPLGVISIAMRSSLAPTPEGIGKRLEALLQQSGPLQESGYSLRVDPIYDPTEFLEKLASAYRITSFWVSFRRPNPIDALRWLQEPLQNALQEAEGQKGVMAMEGEALNSHTLIPISKAFSATGDDVKAKIQALPHGLPRWQKNKGALVGFTLDTTATIDSAYAQMISEYANVRGNEDEI